jgi:hypothetical protein
MGSFPSTWKLDSRMILMQRAWSRHDQVSNPEKLRSMESGTRPNHPVAETKPIEEGGAVCRVPVRASVGAGPRACPSLEGNHRGLPLRRHYEAGNRAKQSQFAGRTRAGRPRHVGESLQNKANPGVGGQGSGDRVCRTKPIQGPGPFVVCPRGHLVETQNLASLRRHCKRGQPCKTKPILGTRREARDWRQWLMCRTKPISAPDADGRSGR